MLEIVQALVARGQAYAREGNVYFRAAAARDFGALSRRTPEEMIARLREERIDPDDPRKEQPLDILMWQAAAPGEPTWESPWGPAGRAGASSVPPWRSAISAPPSTSTAGAKT